MGKSLQSLSLVSLMTMVNNGATTESICNEYSCSEEEFRTRLGEICSRKGTIDSVLANIARNEKKASPESPAVKSEPQVAAGAAMVGASAPRKALSPELNNLTSQESELALKITSFENKSNELLNKHYANTKDLREREEAVEAARGAFESARSAFEAAKDEFEKQERLYDECVETDKKLTEEIASVKVSQQEAEKELEETRKQIYELTHASIRVLADGSFEQTSGKTQMVFDDAGSDALFKSLSEKEEYEDLPVKKVRILAKLIKVVENSSLELEVSCEDADIERAFRQH